MIFLLLSQTIAAVAPPQFSAARTFNSGGVNLSDVTLADVNGDGALDAIAANASGGVGILIGSGDGTFGAPVTFPPGCSAVAVADLNADGNPDLIVTVFGQASVAVLLGNGDGTFQPDVSYSSGLNVAVDVVVTDLNNDGNGDLLVADCGPQGCAPNESGAVGVLLGNGDGTFAPVTTYAGGQPVSIAVGDVNEDGQADVVTANWQLGTVGVLSGNGDGSFQSMETSDAGAVSPVSIAVADLNGDAHLDIAVASFVDTFSPGVPVGVLLGNGDGTFQAVVTYASGGRERAALAIADVNGDGVADLLVASGCLAPDDLACAEGHIGILLGVGDGTFQPAVLFKSGARFPVSIASADLNGDGADDVVAAHFGSGGVPGVVGVLLNGLGENQPPAITISASPGILWPPNSKMVPVSVSGTIRDNGSGVQPGSARYAVIDEYGRVQPSGSITLAVDGSFSVVVLLQASRHGHDRDGRQYTITITAADDGGIARSNEVVVVVPHDASSPALNH